MAKQIRLHALNIPVGQWARKDMLSARRSSGIPIQAEAAALFAQWTSLGTPASAGRQAIVNATIYQLKQAGIWDELDVLYMWAAHSQAAALVDWKNPSTRAATVNGTMTFVADSHFVSNGTTGRLALGYNPGDGGAYKFTQNSNSFGAYIVEPVGENRVEMSAQDGSSQGVDMLLNNASLSVKNNIATAQAIGAAVNRRGLMSSLRTASNAWNNRNNGYNIGADRTDASLAVKNIKWAEFCRNVNGTFSAYSTKKHRYSFAGSGSFAHFTLNRIIEENYLSQLSLAPVKRITFNGNSFTSAGIYAQRALTNINDFSNLDVNMRGISGQTTPQMQTDAVNWVFPFTKSFLTKDIYFVWELTNDMVDNTSNATTCYNNMVTYLQALRTAVGASAKIIVATMLPRNAAQITNANRQNDGNLTDDTTLNGKIRNHLVQDGYCDAICDVASDATMGIYSGGVAGVGEKNTTYYNVDGIHPTTTGYNYLADNYITASIQAYL